MERVSTVIKKISTKHNRGINDTQKKLSEFNDNTSELKNKIHELIVESRGLKKYIPYVSPTDIQVHSNPVFEYEFISKLGIDHIDTDESCQD